MKRLNVVFKECDETPKKTEYKKQCENGMLFYLTSSTHVKFHGYFVFALVQVERKKTDEMLL